MPGPEQKKLPASPDQAKRQGQKIPLLEGMLEQYRVKEHTEFHERIKPLQAPERIGLSIEHALQLVKDSEGEETANKLLETVLCIQDPILAARIAGDVKLVELKLKSKPALHALIDLTYRYREFPDFCDSALDRAMVITGISESSDIGDAVLLKFVSSLSCDSVAECIDRFRDDRKLTKSVGDALIMLAIMTAPVQRDSGVVADIATMIKGSEGVDDSSLSKLFQGGEFWLHPHKLSNLFGEGLLWGKTSRIALYTILRGRGMEPRFPDLSDEWVEEMNLLMADATKKRFGIARKISIEEALLLSGIDPEEDERIMIKEIVDSPPAHKSFSIGKQYSVVDIYATDNNARMARRTQFLLGGLFHTKRRPNHEEVMEEARRYYPKHLLDKARGFLSHFERKHVYNEIQEMTPLVKTGDWRAAGNVLFFLFGLVKRHGDKMPKGASALVALLNIAGSETPEWFDKAVIRMQDMGISNLGGSAALSCCAFYPGEKNRRASIYYLKDPEIALLRVHTLNKKGGEFTELGVMILVNCLDSNGRKALLVDSVEGNAEIYSEAALVHELLETLKKVAAENGASYVIFNSKVAGDTPKRFIAELHSSGMPPSTVELEKIDGVKAIEGWSDTHYLEAFGGWSYPKGTVSGYVLEL